MNEIIEKQKQAVAKLVTILKEAIRDAGGVPSGHLYAILMSQGCSFSQYVDLEDALLRTGEITKLGDVLYWIEDVKPMMKQG